MILHELCPEWPVASLCRVLDVPRSSFYHLRRRHAEEEALEASAEHDEAGLDEAIEAVVTDYATYGYRRVKHELRRRGLEVSYERVRRTMGRLGLLQRRRRRTKRTTQSRHGYRRWPNLVSGLAVTHPDQVWVSDITYVRLAGDFVYLAVIMDVYTRPGPGLGAA